MALPSKRIDEFDTDASISGDEYLLLEDPVTHEYTKTSIDSAVTASQAVSSVNGGTGAISITANSLLPSQAGNSGRLLTTDGSNTSWGTANGTGDMLSSVYDPQNIEGDVFDRTNHTGTQTLSTISDVTATATEVNYTDGVTSAIQTQLNDKPSLTGANSYTAGSKQTMAPSATTAGLNLGNVAGNPSSASEGDVWYNSSTDTVNWRAGASVRTGVSLDAIQTLTNKTLTSPAINTPTGIIKSDVGLGNVDNTSDTGKPVSTAQLTAINAKVADAINDGTTTIAPSQNAVFDALALKQPLDSDLTTIASLTATTDNFVQSKSSTWASRTPTQVTSDLISMVGDSGSGGTKGLVPAPSAGDAAAAKYLKADGTWATPAGGGGGGSGDVVGPSSSTDNAIARFDSTTGKLLQNSTVIADDSGNVSLASLKDTNGNTSVVIGATPSAVNYVDITNGAAGFAPIISAKGTDTNITLYMKGKGSGSLVMADGNAVQVLESTGVASAVNYTTVSNAATAGSPTITGTGSDTNVSLNLATKGTGTVKANNVDVVTTSGTQTLSGKTLTTPTIGSFTNSGHDHTNAAGGGQITDAALSSAVTVAKGGSGRTTATTAYGLIAAGTTATGNQQTISPGTSNQILVSNGASALPTMQTMTASQLPNGAVVQVVSTNYSAMAAGTGLIPNDDTIPQNTEGDEYMSQAITPKSTTNKLSIEADLYVSNSSGSQFLAAALFQDSTANALAGKQVWQLTGTGPMLITIRHDMTAGTTSATTFKVRAGAGGAGTTTFNGVGGVRKFGGITLSNIRITEYKA